PAGARAAFAEYLKDPLKSSTLVLFSEDKKPDPKDALAQAASAAGAVCVVQPLREGEAEEKLKAKARSAGKKLSEEAASTLVAEAGTDWAILSQELEKTLLFSSGEKEITADHALECLGYQKAADPFALSRMIQDRKLKDCLAHLRRLFDT